MYLHISNSATAFLAYLQVFRPDDMTSYYYSIYVSLVHNYYIYIQSLGGGPKGKVVLQRMLRYILLALLSIFLQLTDTLRCGQPCLEYVNGMLACWFGMLC